MTAIEFDYHVSSFGDKLKTFALSLTHNKEDADDLFQDTVLKAFRYRDKYSTHANLKGWLYTIMKNTFINNYRRTKLSRNFMDSGVDEFVMANAKDRYANPESSMNVILINNTIDSIEEDLKVPFKMHFEGFKYKEIADQLSLPIGTVKSRIFLARKKLSQLLIDLKP